MTTSHFDLEAKVSRIIKDWIIFVNSALASLKLKFCCETDPTFCSDNFMPFDS